MGRYLQLQDDLNGRSMGFNEVKCNVLHLGSTNPCYEYSMRNPSLEPITEKKDSGVTIDQDLKFHMHLSKASRMLGLVRATFACINTPQAIHHYGIPSFGNVIWYPRLQCDKLEVKKSR